MHKVFTASIQASVLVAALAIAGSAIARDDNHTPVGTWKTIDDASGKPKSLVVITESNGVLQGKIDKLFRAPNEEQNPKCDKCTGANKDQPIVGLVILSGLKYDGKEWTGGEIMDPANGKTYKSKAELIEGGTKLQVRGYVGVPMFGRSQTWVRED
ncbi:hypothetical protein JAB5_39420 [Janthinobacterium sp. HH103]|uniref:DUF2147 domain-containing protein n=1 Tax=unclassified Janthinobacterium TaxID=2610881 RepID=UPI0008753F9A|nr:MULTISPECIES: DUF2147 domain-containing protein [unclassified Janthinobacterium]MCC7683921.1 DUF2147 domain-containing protein [Janthinobacterium sp. FW305-128]OEZ67130.1 hypothetical protein JAB2_25130 [Janthinobacterium sp. HH100]OEZ71740.1 hypothetical protein JAB5_39420 [Janthinobacterium sp. HH103]OEZ89146.1 hypothetical protein JAB8_27310 [Janthinobacterium sp. HH106]OEZ95597.1 hypothetical protein JAB9_31810 [Janthinobacterium sp. HH107]